jgi:hypothetical protein
VNTLSDFGYLTRYYNLDLIAGGKARLMAEPIRAWWTEVGQPILKEHYTPRKQKKDQASAAATAALITPAHVFRCDEEGKIISDVEALAQRAGASRIVQRYGRLHTLQIVRWLSFLIVDICTRQQIEAFFGLGERFAIFMNRDAYFRTRKTWSIYEG